MRIAMSTCGAKDEQRGSTSIIICFRNWDGAHKTHKTFSTMLVPSILYLMQHVPARLARQRQFMLDSWRVRPIPKPRRPLGTRTPRWDRLCASASTRHAVVRLRKLRAWTVAPEAPTPCLLSAVAQGQDVVLQRAEEDRTNSPGGRSGAVVGLDSIR